MSRPSWTRAANSAGPLRPGVLRPTLLWAGLLWCATIGLCGMPGARAEEDEEVNTLGTSTTLSGLTGLVVTESAHTLPPWTVAVSGSATYLHTSTPASLYEGAGQVAIGLPGRAELAAMLPGVHYDNGGTITGLSDLQLSAKWRFIDQQETQWPSLALAVTGTLPTGKKGAVTLPFSQPGMGLRTVDDYGIAVRLIGSAEIDFTPDQYAVGLYAEGGFSFQDLDHSTQDKYATYALGVALPLLMRAESPLSSPLQLLLEVDGTYKRGADQDDVAVTPSLRYVGPVMVTAGFRYQAIQQSPDAYGAVAQVGFRFH